MAEDLFTIASAKAFLLNLGFWGQETTLWRPEQPGSGFPEVSPTLSSLRVPRWAEKHGPVHSRGKPPVALDYENNRG